VVAAYAAGQMFYFVATGDNTGAVTLNIDSLGAKAVTRDGSVALAAGDIKSGEVVVVVYDGTRFQVVSQLNSAGDARFANVSIASSLYVGGVSTFVGNAGFSANVSIASALSVGGVAAITGATTIGGNLTLNGGTANGVLYLNGSKVATSGTALTFDGTNFGTTGNANLGSGSKSTDTQLNFASDLGTQRIYLDRGTRSLVFYDATTAIENYRIAGITGVQTWGVGGSEQMRLTSTGLGIGTSSPNCKFEVKGGSAITTLANSYTNAGLLHQYSSSILLAIGSDGTNPVLQGVNATNNTAKDLTLQPLGGNLGIGTTTIGSRVTIGDPGTGLSFTNATATSGFNIGLLAGTGSAQAYVFSRDNAALLFGTNNAERARITSGGVLLSGKTTDDDTVKGIAINGPAGELKATNTDNTVVIINRQTNDGVLVSFRQANAEEGTISVSGATVSYNAFAGSHWSQLQDGSKPDILRGTVMESINELCVWPNEQNERLPKSKVSDTAGSKKVYGVFMAWDNDWATTNDMYVTAVGAFICRVNASVTVQEGDLLESNGDGTARVQADDIIRSSTIGKVTSTVKTHQYADGSYCVPTVLYCG
jgi:hypothetical protein